MELLDDFLTDKALEVMSRPEVGGLAGLVEMFRAKGLGWVVSSWIVAGENLSVTPEQIREVFGAELIQQFARHLGMTAPEAPSLIAKLLPIIVIKLARHGSPTHADLLRQAETQLVSHC